jgi:SAM-dependent methyltransferase
MNFPGLTKPVTREDVLWCYRYILRREPESEAAIAPHLVHKNFRSLAESFSQSEEGNQPVTREDVRWCYRHILGREPEDSELTKESLSQHLAHRRFRDLAASFASRANGIRGVTRDEVLWGYRHILRREPESGAAIETHMAAASFRHLTVAMGESYEVIHPVSREDVLWCYRNILYREPAPDEPLDAHLEHRDFQSLAQSFAIRAGGLRAVTAEDVRWCFLHVLGREAGSDEAVAPHLTHRTFRDLVENLANSTEAADFREAAIEGTHKRQQRQQSLSRVIQSEAGATQPRNVDTVATIPDLIKSFRLIKAGVSSSPNFSTALDKADSKAAGDILATLHKYGAFENFPGMFVEFGCNSSGQALVIAKRVQAICICDFSASSLKTVRVQAGAASIENITFQECNEHILISLPACDYFHSASTLQHLPPPVAAAVIRNALRALQPGGIAMFQLLTDIENYTFKLSAWLDKAGSEIQNHVLPEFRVLEIVSGQRCELLNLETTDLGHEKSSIFAVRKPR